MRRKYGAPVARHVDEGRGQAAGAFGDHRSGCDRALTSLGGRWPIAKWAAPCGPC